MKALRLELVESVRKRQATAGLMPVHFAIQIDHGVPGWLVTWLVMQFFGSRRLEALDDADALWLYNVVRKLHNSDLNARLMSEVSRLRRMLPSVLPLRGCLRLHRVCTRQVRNQANVPLSALLGSGHSMAKHGIPSTEWHTHRKMLIDYSSGSGGVPWAVDAAAMLENFHAYAMALYRIGADEAAGSKRQRAAFRLAQSPFDMGDGARL